LPIWKNGYLNTEGIMTLLANLDTYRAALGAPPATIKRWHLTGAGLESLDEAEVPLPHPGPEELLIRHDACGICFSDIKIINLGPDHPRLVGRDLHEEPVVMGHEVALTVIEVGEALKDRFARGQRFIIQPDVYYQGRNVSYGYRLDGGMAEYGLVGKEVLEGDEGCYLLPLKDDTGYVEAALVEPWACVVAAYEYPNYRPGPKPGGRVLIVGRGVDEAVLTSAGVGEVVTVDDAADTDFRRLRADATGEAGFDDVIVTSDVAGEDLARIAAALGKGGILNVLRPERIAGLAAIDAGRIHYEQQLYISPSDPDDPLSAYAANTRGDIKPGGRAWFVGAGGPMGQMHIQRAIMQPEPPAVIAVTDTHEDRLQRIRQRFGKLMDERSIHLVLINPTVGGDPAEHGPYDDIVCLVPSPAVIEDTVRHLARGGVYNIFAGVAIGSQANLDLGTILKMNQRIVGTSGSSIADLRHTLELVESDALSTNASLAAIGGLDAFRDGLAAVKAGRFPGKTVIFPLIRDLPLVSIDEMPERLPNVFAKLQDGLFWTKEAEEELMRERL
jgi:threonine dehydrogenase-like Zn-dependent dehydrogenase